LYRAMNSSLHSGDVSSSSSAPGRNKFNERLSFFLDREVGGADNDDSVRATHSLHWTVVVVACRRNVIDHLADSSCPGFGANQSAALSSLLAAVVEFFTSGSTKSSTSSHEAGTLSSSVRPPAAFKAEIPRNGFAVGLLLGGRGSLMSVDAEARVDSPIVSRPLVRSKLGGFASGAEVAGKC